MSAVVTRLPGGQVELRFTYNAHVIDRLKLHVPAYARSYDPEWKAWTIDATYAQTAAGILEAAFGADHVELIDHVGERFQFDPPAIDSDLAELHLLPSAPPNVITIVYRELAKSCHPDRGGDLAAMQRINVAFDRLKARGIVAGGR